MFCLVAALASSALLFHARRQLWDARAVGAVLETVPLEWFRWPAKRANADIHDKASGYRDFLARLLADDALQLEKARLALQLDGIPFSATFVTRSGAAYAVEGRRAASGDAVVWLLDASAAVTVKRARQEATDLRQMLDAIPLPVWRRGADRASDRLQPGLRERRRHDPRAGNRGRSGAGSRQLPRRKPARCHRRVASAGRDRRGAVPRPEARSDLLATVPISRPPRRSCGGTSTRTPRCSKPSAPRLPSTAPTSGSNSSMPRLPRCGASRRIGSPHDRARRGSGSAPRGSPSPGTRRFPGLQDRPAAVVHLGDRAAAGSACTCPTAAPCGCPSRRIRSAG